MDVELCWIEWRYGCDMMGRALVLGPLGPQPPRQGMCWDFLKFGRSESNSCRSRLGHVRSWRVVPQGKLMWKTEKPWFAWLKKKGVFHATVSLHSVPEISGGKPNIPLILTIVSVLRLPFLQIIPYIPPFSDKLIWRELLETLLLATKYWEYNMSP